ncbi:MAG: cytochrome c3 family protein [Pseudomonadota bacterium]
MKAGLLVVLALVAWVLWRGSPIAEELPAQDHYFGSPAPILPMSFAHRDHTTVHCAECHHNFVDDTGHAPCMLCHVTDKELWPMLEEQFHDLCRGCHVKLAAHGEPGGPPRQCIGCHVQDFEP